MELSSTVTLIKFEQILRSMLFKMLGFPVVIIHLSSTLIKVPKCIVVCKPNSHFLPYWFCNEGRTPIGPRWFYMILSLCWPNFQTVLALGMINDKPNRWASEYLFMYTNWNIYKYTLGETKDFSTLGSSWKPEAMSVLWVHSLVCANMRRLQTCDPDIVDYLQETQALFCICIEKLRVFFFQLPLYVVIASA